FELLDDLAVPTVGAVHGQALGGACELVGYLDWVVATEDARFGLPEIKLGVFPPAAAAFFPARFGHQAAMRMLFTGETIDAAAAVGIGLVSQIARDGDLAGAVEEAIAPLRAR